MEMKELKKNSYLIILLKFIILAIFILMNGIMIANIGRTTEDVIQDRVAAQLVSPLDRSANDDHEDEIRVTTEDLIRK